MQQRTVPPLFGYFATCIHFGQTITGYVLYSPFSANTVLSKSYMKNVTPTSLCQSYYQKVYPEQSCRQQNFLYNTILSLKNMCNFKDCRRLCAYISLYLNTRKLPKLAKLGHGRCFLLHIHVV